jgi:hypothetical protein
LGTSPPKVISTLKKIVSSNPRLADLYEVMMGVKTHLNKGYIDSIISCDPGRRLVRLRLENSTIVEVEEHLVNPAIRGKHRCFRLQMVWVHSIPAQHLDAKDNYDAIDMLIAAYVYSLDQIISEVLGKAQGKLGEVKLLINCNVLASRIALILIEMGLHTVLHLLLKYFRKFHNLRESRLREVLVLSIGGDLVNKAGVARYYLNNLINGFIYRVVTSDDKIKGYMVVVNVKPFSYANMASLVERFDLNDFIRFS